MHQSPSALSKAIRRIETTINTAIFDRIGKTIRLNVDGERLRYRARTLIALADETQAEFRGDRQQLHCRVVSPSLLQWRFAAILANVLTANFPQSGITFGEKFEDTAVVALTQGHADFALIPAAAVNASLPTGIEVLPLGTITMQLAAANSHPIIAAMSDVQRRKPRVSAATVLKHEFACPNHWQFCGIDQGARSDGWHDDKLPPPRSILDRRYATSNSPSAQRPSANLPARFCTSASATQPPARKRLRLRLHRTSLFNVATEYCKWLAGSLGCELA